MQHLAHGTNFAVTLKTPEADKPQVVMKGLVEELLHLFHHSKFVRHPHSRFENRIKIKDASL